MALVKKTEKERKNRGKGGKGKKWEMAGHIYCAFRTLMYVRENVCPCLFVL